PLTPLFKIVRQLGVKESTVRGYVAGRRGKIWSAPMNVSKQSSDPEPLELGGVRILVVEDSCQLGYRGGESAENVGSGSERTGSDLGRCATPRLRAAARRRARRPPIAGRRTGRQPHRAAA